ncbi:glutamate racemase [Caminibacter mediatlanticus]|uniref:Glutamate racemase n=1 Tax=Caminibacter mediatlanticus TB-2 TaxID=391592 RepID=A0AAI9AJ35_9BACT|nr:glutamate racemase [Caminibacter mediatlanticus]EDM24465.1 glutamate racemase [Caminibacter mediatlanticus TB-2]
MNRCGIFDSGVGGLSVAREILKSKLFDEIIYFGDTARVPYGNKNESTIIRYSLECLEFLKNFNIDFLVVACNSASSVAIEELRKEVSFPVVGVIEAGIKAIENENKNSNILLIGTKRTISSSKYQNALISLGFKNIISIATPLLVPLVEEGIVEGKIVDDIFEMYFRNLDKEKIDIIILGCTHYPFLEKSFKKHFPNAKLIHSGQAIVKLLKKEYNLKPKQISKIEIYASDNVEEVRKIAKKWLK